jgi:hypothetical protein
VLEQYVTVVWRIQGHSVLVQYVSMEDTRIQVSRISMELIMPKDNARGVEGVG